MDVSTLLVITAALGAGGFAKGVTGMGLPLVALPALTPFVGLHHAICIMLIPSIATNSWQMWCHRKDLRDGGMAFLPLLVAASLVGTLGGTAVLAIANERALVLAVAATIFLYLLLRLARPTFLVTARAAVRAAVPVGIMGGLFQGATGISGPVFATFLHAMGLGHGRFVSALSAVFLTTTISQSVGLTYSGILEWRWLLEGLFALLPLFIFVPLGQRFGRYISPRAFNRLIMSVLGLMGVLLVLDL